MKIAIITFCEAVNYGAFLQAFSLGAFLKAKGHTVKYIRKNSWKTLYWEFHNLYAYHLDRITFRNEFRRKWLKAKKRLDITYQKKGYDLLVIGSDEMWQLNGETTKPLPLYWGIGVEAKKKISYAVCSNGSTTEQARCYAFILNGLRDLDAISVRDEKTYEVFRPLTDKTIQMVVDPTFLIDLHRYAVPTNLKDYILVYTYSFDVKKIREVQEYARQTRKKIVCIGNKFDWCDISVPASPFEVLGIFAGADYVVTDTFHGAVLATHFKRNFAAYTSGKEKVRQYLKEFQLENRIADNSTLDAILKNEIDYDLLEKVIHNKREMSIAYIEQFLE